MVCNRLAEMKFYKKKKKKKLGGVGGGGGGRGVNWTLTPSGNLKMLQSQLRIDKEYGCWPLIPHS